MKDSICIGMAGAGRATELHMLALDQYSGIPVRRKTIMARRKEPLEHACKRYRFEQITMDFNEMIRDPEIDLIDICTPAYVHVPMIRAALDAGKHVICEKSLTGYFGQENDPAPIGTHVSKQVMYEKVLEDIDSLAKVVQKANTQFMYAENFIYAPAIWKAADIIAKKKSRILFAKGEESLKGSSSPVAGQWNKTGGGTFIRTGTHPLSAILWLKEQEAKAQGKEIRVVSVLADMGRILPQLTEYEHRHIAARPVDVEDCGTVILTFSDSTRAVIMATDTLLGGSRNYVELYCNDAVIHCKLTMNDMMETYFLDEERLDEVEISEMLPSKLGWNRPFLADEFVRGYCNEMKDFIECAYYNRKPMSDFKVAYDSVKITYAAYLSAERGAKVELPS